MLVVVVYTSVARRTSFSVLLLLPEIVCIKICHLEGAPCNAEIYTCSDLHLVTSGFCASGLDRCYLVQGQDSFPNLLCLFLSPFLVSSLLSSPLLSSHIPFLYSSPLFPPFLHLTPLSHLPNPSSLPPRYPLPPPSCHDQDDSRKHNSQ